MCRTSSPRPTSAVVPSKTLRPLRRTVTRSAISNTSSRRCVTKSISRPLRLTCRTLSNRRSRSWIESTALGSSSARIRVDAESARDLDQLPTGDADRSRDRVGVERQAVALEQLARLAAHLLPVETAPRRARLPREPDVLGDRQLRQHGELLVDRRDAGARGIG